MGFEFHSPTRIVFGHGALQGIGQLVRSFGRHAFVVTGRNPARGEPLRERLTESDIATTFLRLGGEPTLDDITRGLDQARAADCDLVIGIGGGSAIDAAKAVAALLTNEGELSDFLEVVGRARSLSRPAAPCVAIPTTAGTGSEVTRNAVLASPSHRVKVSLRSPFLAPRLALVDPSLTRSLPPDLTATTGLDALTQLIEPLVSARANPLTDSFCRDGIARVARSLRRAVADGGDAAAREDLAIASLLSGLALANAGLGAVHGIAGPLGGRFPIPHGAACAVLLAPVMAANLRALRARAPNHAAISHYDEIARLLTGRKDATAYDGVAWIRQLAVDLRIPSLADHGVRREELPTVVEAATKASSMRANPLPLTMDELAGLLEAAM